MPYNLKKRRKYNVKDEKMIRHIVECIKSVPKHEIQWRLDDYERNSIRNPLRWAKTASMDELMIVVTKLGFQSTWQMVDERNPMQAYELLRNTKELNDRKKFSEIIELAKNHRYFCLTGREFLKWQSYFSLYAGSTVFKMNGDSARMLKSALSNNIRNQKSIDNFIYNVLETIEVGDLDLTDLRILFYVRLNDDAPVNTFALYEKFYTLSPHILNRHLAKLYKYQYLERFGVKKASSYALTQKAWQALMNAKKQYFNGIRLWDLNESLEMGKELEMRNGTIDSKPESDQKRIA